MMTTNSPSTGSTSAERLLDAHVRWVVDELSGDRLTVVVEREVDEFLARAGQRTVGDVLPEEALAVVVDLLLHAVASSDGVAEAVTVVADQLHDGPPEPTRLSEIVDREQVAALVDALMPMRPLVGRTLDQLTGSPAAGVLASRFISRLVVDVLEANRSVASRVPGLGGIVSIGTRAATSVVGAADRQVQALLGDAAAGRGAAVAVRRLNGVVMATLEDPALRDAALEAYDELADDEFVGLGTEVERTALRRLAGVVAGTLGTAAAAPPTRSFLVAGLTALREQHRDRSVQDALAAHGIGREEVLVLGHEFVVPLIRSLVADGTIASVVRERLAPFYGSAEVATILDEA